MAKAKNFKDYTDEDMAQIFQGENIFEDADLILQENIFDDENGQNKVFTDSKDEDKQAVVQIIEQIESPQEEQVEQEKSLADVIDSQNEQELPSRVENDDHEGQVQDEYSVQQKQNSVQDKENIDNTEEHKYGKFKTPEELLRAYGELEKEFTRRSQKLKELENASAEAFKSEEDWRAAVDKFFEETPSAKVFSKDIANEIISHPELKKDKNCLSIALTRTLVSKFRTPEQLLSDGQFLKDYVLKSQAVKDAVIAEYLQGVRDGEPPYVLGGGGRQFATSAKSPKTIEEAGFMFLKQNK